MFNDFEVGSYDRQHLESLREDAARERLANACHAERRSLLQTVRDAAERLMQR